MTEHPVLSLHRVVSGVLIAALAQACARPTPAAQVIDATVRAIGGRAQIEAARTLVVEGEGEGFVLGQGTSPDNGSLKYRITELRRGIDFTNGRWRQDQVLTPLWAAQDPSPQKDITAVDDRIAFDIGADGAAARSTDAVARERRTELWHSPLGILRAALAPDAQVANHRRVGDHDVVDVRASGGEVFTLTIDGTTHLPLTVASMADHPNLGDVTVETEFAGYRQAGALKLPTLITSRLDRKTVAAIRVSNYAVNAPVGDLAAPAPVRSASPAVPDTTVTVEELAPGVWLLAGGSHHSVAAEFADHLVLIEAPVDDARTLAVIAKARQLRPAKPLTQVVSTHHHFDHSGGVRAAVSEGLTIVAHERSKDVLDELVSRAHTIAPDALARRPRPLKLETVSGRMTLGDSTHPVELYAADSPHAETMLVAYLPRERLLIEVDLYTAPPPNSPPLNYPYAGTLLRLVESRNMRVDRVVALHRRIVPFTDLVAAARQAPPPSRP